MTARKKCDLRHGEGSFLQRKSDGVWVGVLEAGWTTDGRRERATVASRDKDTAWDTLTALRKRQVIGQQVVTSSRTMKAWTESWLKLRSHHLAPSTLPQYRSRIRRWS
ncbi:hypothetical protein [uncultured Tessaracoccus sp.]|uniref:hypothetical protein n=1 Tax=uncultured Tessaracoccus sp. TaxID=905023 RepID=UPI0025F514A1|nr:hypothetical protein [uncultured Tessaracoccus sp.]